MQIGQAEAVLLAQRDHAKALLKALTGRGPELMALALRSKDGIASTIIMGYLTPEERVGYALSALMGFGTVYEFYQRVKNSAEVFKEFKIMNVLDLSNNPKIVTSQSTIVELATGRFGGATTLCCAPTGVTFEGIDESYSKAYNGCLVGMLSQLMVLRAAGKIEGALASMALSNHISLLDLEGCWNLTGDVGLIPASVADLNLKDCQNIKGVLPPHLLALLLEGHASLNGCGAITLPPAEVIAQADPAVVERIQAVRKVNFEDFPKFNHESFDLDAGLPECLIDVLSRVEVLQAGRNKEGRSMFRGAIANLATHLSGHIRMLDLEGCSWLTGTISHLASMNLKALNLKGCYLQGDVGLIPASVTDLNLENCENIIGNLSPHHFALLLEGHAKLKGCGALTLPSAEAIAQADPAVVERIQAVREVSFEDFPKPFDLDAGLPECLADVLSRVEVLRGRRDGGSNGFGQIGKGKLMGVVGNLALSSSIRILDLGLNADLSGDVEMIPASVTDLNLEGCKNIEGTISHLASMNLKALNLKGCYLQGDVGLIPASVTDLNLENCENIIGNLSPHHFALLLEGHAKLKGCGALTLPSAEAIAQADPAVVERIQAVREVSFEDFPKPFDLDAGLPECLADVLSRVEVLRGRDGDGVNNFGLSSSWSRGIGGHGGRGKLRGALCNLALHLSGHVRMLDLEGCSGLTGEVPLLFFALLLEGRANLKGCGTLTLPSAEAIAQADPTVVERIQAVREVDLSGMGNLAGELPPHLFALLLEGHANLKGCGVLTLPSAKAIAQADLAVVERIQAVREVDLSDGLSNMAAGPSTQHPRPTSKPFTFHREIETPTRAINLSGQLPPLLFSLLLEGQTGYLKGCGTLTLPSAEAIAQADPAVVERIQAVHKVDLSGMSNLAGELLPHHFALLLEGRANLKGCGATLPSAEAIAQADPAVVERIQAVREVSFEDFPKPFDLDAGLPECLADVLSRVEVLRGGGGFGRGALHNLVGCLYGGSIPSEVIKKLTVPQLKGMCNAKGLNDEGKKAELVERLSGGVEPTPSLIRMLDLNHCDDLTGDVSLIPASVTDLNLEGCKNIKGVLPQHLLALLSEGRINLKGCDQIRLPSTSKAIEADPALVPWVQALVEYTQAAKAQWPQWAPKSDRKMEGRLFQAAEEGDEAAVQALIDDRAVNIEANDGIIGTALHEASKSNCPAIMRLLLDAGANVHAVNTNGWTALHWASKGNSGCVLEAVAGGARLTARTKYDHGQTALDVATGKTYGSPACTALLEEAAGQPDPAAWARARLGR